MWRSQGGTSPGPPWSGGGGGSFGVGDELLELGRGGETATQRAMAARRVSAEETCWRSW